MTDQQQMLCLAALSYRSFADPRWLAHAERLRKVMAAALVELAPVCGAWDLVWGPAAYRAPLSSFDDNLMFVVRSREAGHRYAVVVRGTNPVSGLDWLLGDFWVGSQAPWPYGHPKPTAAKVSFSTLLGLNVLQLLQAPPPEPQPGLLGDIRRLVTSVAGNLPDVAAILAPFGDRLAADRQALRDATAPILDALAAPRREVGGGDVRGLLEAWQSDARRKLFTQGLDLVRFLDRNGSSSLLRFLEGSARLSNRIEPGISLLAFLTAVVSAAEGEPVEVVVAGHSKGGALATALALWLADTQGREVARAFRWDPAERATVSCYSYAGPTAGNQAFVDHANTVLAGRCHRIVNPLDIVPHAWQAADLRRIEHLYEETVPDDLLRDLLTVIAVDVAPAGYAHVDLLEPVPGTREQDLPTFFQQLVYQHMEAYLRGLGLPPHVTTRTFFGLLGA